MMERLVSIPTDKRVEFGTENRVRTGSIQMDGIPFESPVHYVRWDGGSYQINVYDMEPHIFGQVATDCLTLETVRINYADFVQTVLSRPIPGFDKATGWDKWGEGI